MGGLRCDKMEETHVAEPFEKWDVDVHGGFTRHGSSVTYRVIRFDGGY